MKRDGCRGKVRHSSEVGARAAARRIKNAALNVYPCAKCSGWHLGKTRDPARCADRIGQVLAKHQRALAERLAK